MRQQRAIVVASVGFTAALAGAVPVALLALDAVFAPAPLRPPSRAVAAAPPMALPALTVRPHPHPHRAPAARRTRRPSSTTRSTAVPGPGQVAGTIIPAQGVSSPSRPATTIPARPRLVTPRFPSPARRREGPGPHRRRAERTVRATRRTAHVPAAPPRPAPARPAPSASIAAVQAPSSAKALRKALKALERAQKQLQKAMRHKSKDANPPQYPGQNQDGEDG